jgi:hypothetical protein
MTPSCPQCKATSIKKNGSIHNGKQKYECLVCRRQFVEEPVNKQIPGETKERIKRALLEKVSLEGICRIFDVSLPWLLGFMQETFEALPDHLNATVVTDNDEFLVAVLEMDELWSYVGTKKNPQWLWLVMDSKSRQIVAFHVGDRSKAAGEAIMAKIPTDLKKKPSFTQIVSQLTTKFSPLSSIVQSEKSPERHLTLRDLTALCDKDVQS